GTRGEIVAIPLSDHQERFERLGRVYLCRENNSPAEFEVESVRYVSGSMVLKFRGIESINEADPWRGAEGRSPGAERLELGTGEFYLSDLTGCEVVERGTGLSLGVVTGFSEAGTSGLLLEVGPDLLIPFARSICVAIDVAAKRIEVDLPEGLKDLNRR